MAEPSAQNITIQKLEYRVNHLTDQVRQLKQQVALVERENSRRKTDIQQLTAAIKRG